MSTQILDFQAQVDLQPAHALWQLYRPEDAPYRFRAETQAEAERWQAETRRALDEVLGFQEGPLVDPEPQVIESVDRGDYVREKVLLRTSPYTLMPVYLLLPKKAAYPRPSAVAFHGHGYGVKDIVGLWEDGDERDSADGYHKDFAVALCRRGFAVAAPEISCFGERQTDFGYLDGPISGTAPTTCDHTAKLAFHLGGSALGLRVWDAKRLIDYLGTRPEFDVARLGAMGISGGGMHTFFSTCLDERIRACVVSGYYCTFRDSILAMSHCTCNFVPGLGRFGEMYDLVGLISPRPLLIESASKDPIFPVASARASLERARQVYGVWGAAGQVEGDFFEGRHQISGRRAYDFLWEKLA
jgi:dienelactone hydrolase